MLKYGTSFYEKFGFSLDNTNNPDIIIKHNKNGILVKGSFDDYDKLAAKLDKLVNNKRKLKAMQNFYDYKFLFRNDKNYVFKKWEKLINNLL
jgi:glycosyltransferase involved in cell wall biosynthesis